MWTLCVLVSSQIYHQQVDKIWLFQDFWHQKHEIWFVLRWFEWQISLFIRKKVKLLRGNMAASHSCPWEDFPAVPWTNCWPSTSRCSTLCSVSNGGLRVNQVQFNAAEMVFIFSAALITFLSKCSAWLRSVHF